MKKSETYLIFGGTGSLGTTLTSRLLSEKKTVFVFSRDEAKHHRLRLLYPTVHSIIGDIRNYDDVFRALRIATPRYVINAAAMKQIPLCEEFPYEALLTNTVGTQNLVHAVHEYERTHTHPLTVLSVSTDKACEPVNAYGMTKALQERIHLRANESVHAILTGVRYGNVLESTGSVIPIFRKKIEQGEALEITDPNMTRFLLSLDEAVDLIMLALKDTEGGTLYVPNAPSATVGDLADTLIAASGKKIHKKIVGIRPGEKIHEKMISKEELGRTKKIKNAFVIHAQSPKKSYTDITQEYSSADRLLAPNELLAFLRKRKTIA